MLSQKELVNKLLEPDSYPHPTNEDIILIETNISWVFLTGSYAYKMKKEIKFGDVLNFSSVEKRKQACEDEIILNKRLAPSLYLNIEPINKKGIIDSLSDAPIEFLVKMKELPQENLLSNIVQKESTLKNQTIENIAKRIAQFHKENIIHPKFSIYDNIFEKWDENFRTTRTYDDFPFDEALANRVYTFLEENKSFWEDRKQNGKIVDGHGDLILANIFEEDGKITIFDCIEFNESLRIQDILEEAAFLSMDLDYWNLKHLSDLFLETYLSEMEEEINEIMPFIQFYKSYRAYVRAKVFCSQSIQEQSTDKKMQLLKLTEKYMKLSSSYIF